MEYPLTKEQESIVSAPFDHPLMVLAPPGTGKTHTVIARIVHLLENQNLRPNQLLVLCFSRAAVSEIMNRLRKLIQDARVHDDLRFVSVRTFDSFATLLLLNADPERNLSGSGYDRRIQMVVDELGDQGSMVSDLVSQYHHVIVDEIQDVVGVRASLVQALLNRITGGFTLLGDPVQAIYGFSSAGTSNRLNSQDLLEWIRAKDWLNGLMERHLSLNYRSSGKPAQLAKKAREILQVSDQPLTTMQEFIANLDTVGSINNPGSQLTGTDSDAVCILCRTNGEMLQIASFLSSKGIGYHIRPRIEDQGLPAWLGRVLGPYPDSRITYPEFLHSWENLVDLPDQPEPDQAFHWLKRVEGNDTPDLNIQNLHRNLYKGARLPDEADAYLLPSKEKITLSTIHAAKGREFDSVAVLKPNLRLKEKEDKAEEARVYYVAATRAKKALFAMGRQGLPAYIFTVSCNNNRRRWVVGLKQPGCYFMEIGLHGDVDIISPVSTWLTPTQTSATENQNHIWKNIHPGSPFYIYRLAGNHLGYRIKPHKSIVDDSRDFAQLSDSFSDDLKVVMRNLSRGRRFRYPGYWGTVRAAAIVTEVLPPFSNNIHSPFSESGFCLGVRLRGMAYISLEGQK